MILLDTNVVAEFMKPEPARKVDSWLSKQARTLFISSITIAEIMQGIERLPKGARRQFLEERFSRFMNLGFASLILNFDDQTAYAYGRLQGTLHRIGRPMSQSDAMIAAIALHHQCSIATRNEADFVGTGVHIINPWAT